VNSIPNDLELVHAKFVVKVAHLSLLSNVSPDPLRLDGLFALVVDVLIAQLEACAHVILTFKRKS